MMYAVCTKYHSRSTISVVSDFIMETTMQTLYAPTHSPEEGFGAIADISNHQIRLHARGVKAVYRWNPRRNIETSTRGNSSATMSTVAPIQSTIDRRSQHIQVSTREYMQCPCIYCKALCKSFDVPWYSIDKMEEKQYPSSPGKEILYSEKAADLALLCIACCCTSCHSSIRWDFYSLTGLDYIMIKYFLSI